MDSLYLIMFVGLSFFVLFLFIYILRVEKAFESKMEAFEMTLENINRDIFLLKKELNNSSSLDKIDTIEQILDSVVDKVRDLENKYSKLISSLKSEIRNLQSEIKKSKLPDIATLSKSEEDKIISLYKRGYSIEEISKELRVPIGEVEFIVKFASNP